MDHTHARRRRQAARSLAEPRAAGNAAASDAAADFCVVIPALDEAATLDATLAHLRRLDAAVDIVVADGGSRDATRAVARARGARVVTSERGRGTQMNAGARATLAPVLVFLHADCRLPDAAFASMRSVLERGHDAGLFAIRYPSRHPLLCLAGVLSRFETPWSSFGEGALFVRRSTFERVGGFPDWPLFEDVEILARLRRAGRLGRAHGRVTASPRRYLERGVWRQQLRNVLLLALFRLGVAPARLASLYDGGGGRFRP